MAATWQKRRNPLQGNVGGASASSTTKKLILKNFTAPKKLTESFGETQWKTSLQAAVQAIFNHVSFATSQEALYQNVKRVCTHGFGQLLYDNLKTECEAHLQTVKAKLTHVHSSTHTAFLTEMDNVWDDYCNQIKLIRTIFEYMDRAFVLQRTDLASIWDLGLNLFANVILAHELLRNKLISGLLWLVRQDRTGEAVDQTMLSRLLKMLRAVFMYKVHFANPFLEESREFYKAEAMNHLQDSDIVNYLGYVQGRIEHEQRRAQYCLDESTHKPIIDVVEDELLAQHADTIIEKGLEPLMDDQKISDLVMMFCLLRSVSKLSELRAAFIEYIKKRGYTIVGSEERDKAMVESLLQFKTKIDDIVRNSFEDSPTFKHAVKESFESFINRRHNKPAELIAKFIDSKLRVGNKGCTEADLEELMDQTMVLFRFISGKDVFEAFYKTHLAKRLLLQKSASVDAERSMLSKLKQECGSQFTGKLEGMFKDVNISTELTQSFRQSVSSREQIESRIELNINVLTASNWPSYPAVKVILPAEMTKIQEVFQEFYCSKHPHRQLVWQNTLGHCLVNAIFPSGKKDLHVSVFQTIVLLLFNDHDRITCSEIQVATGIEPEELKRTLQSLACGKVRVLTKNPKGKEVNDSDVFTVNAKFSNPHKRIKINQIQLKETKEENKATQDKVFMDRVFTIDAAIVRIMKTRKSLKHSLLIAQLYEQLQFPVKPSDLKKRIESLIDRDYMERDSEDQQTYRYLA